MGEDIADHDNKLIDCYEGHDKRNSYVWSYIVYFITLPPLQYPLW